MTPVDRKKAFKLLGIPETDDQVEIRRAWRALVRTYHPDLAKQDRAAANKRLVEINAAFDLLTAGALKEKRKFSEEAMQNAEVARRARAAQMAEERRRTEARHAEAERRAFEAEQARRIAEEARKEAAKRAKEAQTARQAASENAREASIDIESDKSAATAIQTAIRAFTSALAMFAAPKNHPEHNFTA